MTVTEGDALNRFTLELKSKYCVFHNNCNLLYLYSGCAREGTEICSYIVKIIIFPYKKQATFPLLSKIRRN